jgi:hypothetical protein
MSAAVAPLPQSKEARRSAALGCHTDGAYQYGCRGNLAEIECNRERKQDWNAPAAYAIRAPRERKENLLALLFQNEPSAGHLEMRQFGEERHPEQPNLKPIVGEHRGRDVAH